MASRFGFALMMASLLSIAAEPAYAAGGRTRSNSTHQDTPDRNSRTKKHKRSSRSPSFTSAASGAPGASGGKRSSSKSPKRSAHRSTVPTSGGAPSAHAMPNAASLHKIASSSRPMPARMDPAHIVQGFREFLPNSRYSRPAYSQDPIFLPVLLSDFDNGYDLYTDKDKANWSRAQIFGEFLKRNKYKIRELLESPDIIEDDKRPITCPATCSIHTYPAILIPVMRQLQSKHDNLRSTVFSYLPVTRAEVHTPAQLSQYFQAHLAADVTDGDCREFCSIVLTRCFTFKIQRIAEGFDIIDQGNHYSHEYPRIDLRVMQILFPNFKCCSQAEALQTCQAFLALPLINEWYQDSCVIIAKTWNEYITGDDVLVPTLSIMDHSSGIEETGAPATPQNANNPLRSCLRNPDTPRNRTVMISSVLSFIGINCMNSTD